MAFIQAAAPFGQREGNALSVDNAPPERHIVVDLLRKAAPMLGLKPPVLATLEAMLGCLAPKRSHHTVFASNATLAFRRNGISDRTLRRHVVLLSESGLLCRNDSPNRKRYSRRNPIDGQALRFGFDLSPLFARLQEIAHLAAAATREDDRRAYLRCKLRAAAQQALARNPEHAHAQEALRMLRRNLSSEQCEALLAQLETIAAEGADDSALQGDTPLPCSRPAQTLHASKSERIAARDGQNVRHHHKSNKENTEKEEKPFSVPQLLSACPEAAQFSLGKISTAVDVIAHARTLAPMIGIDMANYEAAQARLGPMGAAVTVWAMVQFNNRIHRAGAYFRSITSGRRSERFDPFRLVRRLAASVARDGMNSPLQSV